jgi:hypothetical protein
LNTTDIIPNSVPDAARFNSIAESIGLHDFYQNSLWGYCEGYNGNEADRVNITDCSKPVAMYTFDPLEIFDSELLAGQSVMIPTNVQDDINRLHTASRWMFALYIVGLLLAGVSLLTGLTTFCSRMGSVIATIISFLAFVFIVVASIEAQIVFIIYRNAVNDNIKTFNVTASLGTTIFAFTWIASIAAFAAFFGFMIGICCGTDNRRYRENRFGKFRKV